MTISDSAPAAPPTADDDPLFTKIEEAIKLASELGEESVYDFVHGRGMKLMRERIRDELAALRASLADARRQADDANQAIEDALFAMREPMTLGDARTGRKILTGHSVQRSIAAARAAKEPT